LTELNISGNKVGDSGAEELADYLMKNNESLTAIDISDNEITDSGLARILNALLSAKKLKYLDISVNKIDTNGYNALRSLLKVS